jgi:uncharacterized membrane protein YqhA
MKKSNGFGRIERIFEKWMFNLRFFTIIPVIALAIGSFFVLILGTNFIYTAGKEFILNYGSLKETIADDIILKIITAIDLFLFWIIMIILSMGMYDIFISDLEPVNKKGTRPSWMIFHNLDDLKRALVHVIIIILIIDFFKYVVRFQYNNPYEILVIPIGIALIGLGLYLFHHENVE